MDDRTVKDVARQSAPGFFFSLGVLFLVFWLRPGVFLILAGVLWWVLVAHVWKAYRLSWLVSASWGWDLIGSAGLAVGAILGLWLLEFWFGSRGFWGLLLIVCVVAAYRIWRSWNLYMWAVRESYRLIKGEYPKR